MRSIHVAFALCGEFGYTGQSFNGAWYGLSKFPENIQEPCCFQTHALLDDSMTSSAQVLAYTEPRKCLAGTSSHSEGYGPKLRGACAETDVRYWG